MVLLHAGAFGAMRREIIQALGLGRGEAALRRIGHVQGERDAALIRQRWRNQHPMTQRAAGPWLHTLEGFAKVRTLQYEYDPHDGAFRAEFLWSNSVEADEHLAAFGVSDQPSCWTLVRLRHRFLQRDARTADPVSRGGMPLHRRRRDAG